MEKRIGVVSHYYDHIGVAVLVLGGLVWAAGLPYSRARAHATRK